MNNLSPFLFLLLFTGFTLAQANVTSGTEVSDPLGYVIYNTAKLNCHYEPNFDKNLVTCSDIPSVVFEWTTTFESDICSCKKSKMVVYYSFSPIKDTDRYRFNYFSSHERNYEIVSNNYCKEPGPTFEEYNSARNHCFESCRSEGTTHDGWSMCMGRCTEGMCYIE